MGIPDICRLPNSSTSTQLISQPVFTQYQKYHVQHQLCSCRQVCEWQFRKPENPQWGRHLESLSQKNYIKRFQFTRSFFSHMLQHLEYRRAFHVCVCSQTKCCTDFYLLGIGISFVVFRYPRDTLQSELTGTKDLQRFIKSLKNAWKVWRKNE